VIIYSFKQRDLVPKLANMVYSREHSEKLHQQHHIPPLVDGGNTSYRMEKHRLTKERENEILENEILLEDTGVDGILDND